jgi:hypothetical protein
MTDSRAPLDQTRFSSRRARFRRRLLLFTFSFAMSTLLFGGVLFSVVEIYIPAKRLGETNQKTFERVHCDFQTCDVTEIANDWEFAASDYLLDKKTNFLLNIDQPAADFFGFPLRYSDPAFISRFNPPASISTPARESWRLYSATNQVGSRAVVVMVGYAEKASWKMDLPPPPTKLIDDRLKQQLASIERTLRENSGRVQFESAVLKRKIAADGYEIVDLSSSEILGGGYQIPVYLPSAKPLPSEGLSFWRDKLDLYIVRVDANERLLAVSTNLIGDLPTLVSLFTLLFTVSGVVGYVSGSTFLRKYFLFKRANPHTVDEAIRLGEGPSIEFKRNLSFESASSTEQLLQSVAAFANTGDGTIFIGIDDEAKITGVGIDGAKQRDRISQRIYQLIRQRIRPVPPIQVGFLDVRGFTVLTVFVPRGEEPLHFVDGVIYVRYGASDIKAQPEIVKKLLAQHAF